MRGSPSAGSSNCSPPQDDCTTCHGYPADGVVCTMITPGRAMARGAFVLVGPAAVVEARLAGEQLRIPVRIVVEHDQDLALQVDALEVVPLVLGRFDAVADEHEAGVVDGGGRRLHARAGDVVVGQLEIDVAVLALERPHGRQLRRGADDVDGLFPAALLAAR